MEPGKAPRVPQAIPETVSSSGTRVSLRVVPEPGRPPAAGGGDRQLLAGLRVGSPSAIEALLDRFHGKVHHLASSILGSESDAEEASREVFLAVVRDAHTFKGSSTLSYRIYRICVDACLARLRGKHRCGAAAIEPFLPVFTEEGAHAGPVDDWSGEIERRMPGKEMGGVIRKITDDLPLRYRLVFLLSDVEGMAVDEAAGILGLPVPVMRSRLHRARLYLRERLSRHLGDGPSA